MDNKDVILSIFVATYLTIGLFTAGIIKTTNNFKNDDMWDYAPFIIIFTTFWPITLTALILYLPAKLIWLGGKNVGNLIDKLNNKLKSLHNSPVEIKQLIRVIEQKDKQMGEWLDKYEQEANQEVEELLEEVRENK